MARLADLARMSLLLVLLPVLAGCAGLTPTAGPANSFVTGGTLTGRVHGGNQPVGGATISLYAAGTSGYGSAATLYAQTTTATDGTGSFSLTQTTGTNPTGAPSTITSSYACPTGSTTNPNPEMYLISSGGATQGVGNGTNSAAAFIVAIGKCSNAASVQVNMNEVTSVSTMAALQQYFNPATESFGYPNTTQATLGFANGVAAIANLVNLATGTAISSTSYASTPTGATNSVTVTVTPDVNQINLIANILAACVNTTSSTSSNCATLFADAVPPSPSVTSQPSQSFSTIGTGTNQTEDTNQALYFMLTNPDSGGVQANMTSLFGLAAPQAPFQPSYATSPTDWTVAVSYSSSTKCTFVSGNGTSSSQTFLEGVDDPAIDSQGNMWADAAGSAGGLFEISPTGKPLTCALGGLAATPTPAVIDTAGNVWVGAGVKANSYYNFYRWNPSGSYTTWPASTSDTPQSATADGYGNLFYADSAGNLNEFTAAATAASVSAPGTIAAVGTSPIFMQVDSLDNIWVTNTVQSLTSSGVTASIYEVYPSNDTTGATYMAGTSNGSYTGFQTANIAGSTTGTDSQIYSPYGIAVQTLNNSGTYSSMVYATNGAGSGSAGYSYRWVYITPGSTAGTATITDSAVGLAGNSAARGIAVDGAGNVWQANNNASTGNWVTGSTTALYSVSEISATGAALSATSASGTGSYGANTGGFQKQAGFLKTGARGVAVDPTGNVWFGQNSSTTTNIMELLGAGVPLVTPLAVGAKNNALGQMP
jgi:hypothetical protein